jgi:hypothetical protein
MLWHSHGQSYFALGSFFRSYALSVGWDSAVRIAARYGLDGSGIESRRGEFSAPVQTGPGVYPTSCRLSTGSLPGVMLPGSGVDHSLPSGAGVKERIDTYLYSFSVPSCHAIEWTSHCTCLRRSDARKNNRQSWKTSGVPSSRCRKWSPSVSYMQIYGEWQKLWPLLEKCLCSPSEVRILIHHRLPLLSEWGGVVVRYPPNLSVYRLFCASSFHYNLRLFLVHAPITFT